jgi:hypothetical protein
MQWAKGDLAREVARLRAINREHAESIGDDPRRAATTGSIVDPSGDPHGTGSVIVDARSAVLLDGVDVTLVDTKADDPVAMMMALTGRLNYSVERVEHAYLFGADGAAGLVTQIIGLAGSGLPHARAFAEDYDRELQRRLGELP